MGTIHKIEIAAKCSNDNVAAKNLIQSLPHTLTFKLNRYGSDSIEHIITFDDAETLSNNTRYALILSHKGLGWPINDIRSVSSIWIPKSSEDTAASGYLHVLLSSDDSGYDHVLTDVRYNDRFLPVSEKSYSICSSLINLNTSTYIDIYITIHTI